MNLEQLKKELKIFERSGKTSEQLNALRTVIFDSLDAKEIREAGKNSLLKELYTIANFKGLFFIRIMVREQGLPKNLAEEMEIKADYNGQ